MFMVLAILTDCNCDCNCRSKPRERKTNHTPASVSQWHPSRLIQSFTSHLSSLALATTFPCFGESWFANHGALSSVYAQYPRDHCLWEDPLAAAICVLPIPHRVTYLLSANLFMSCRTLLDNRKWGIYINDSLIMFFCVAHYRSLCRLYRET